MPPPPNNDNDPPPLNDDNDPPPPNDDNDTPPLNNDNDPPPTNVKIEIKKNETITRIKQSSPKYTYLLLYDCIASFDLVCFIEKQD